MQQISATLVEAPPGRLQTQESEYVFKIDDTLPKSLWSTMHAHSLLFRYKGQWFYRQGALILLFDSGYSIQIGGHRYESSSALMTALADDASDNQWVSATDLSSVAYCPYALQLKVNGVASSEAAQAHVVRGNRFHNKKALFANVQSLTRSSTSSIIILMIIVLCILIARA